MKINNFRAIFVTSFLFQIIRIQNFQVPNQFTTEEMGPGDWMTDSDKTKLRLNYECDGGKSFQIL